MRSGTSYSQAEKSGWKLQRNSDSLSTVRDRNGRSPFVPLVLSPMPLSAKEREHYRANFNKAAVACIQGELIELTYVKPDKGIRFPGRRGQVKGFTRSARLRMLRTVARVDWTKVNHSVFITLTYPPGYEGRSVKERNQDRYRFMRDMEKHLERKVGSLWRVEWEKRKSGPTRGTWACHVHIIVFNCRFIHKDVVRDGWRRALNATGPLITWIDGITNGRKASRYVSKYCAKPSDASVLDNASYLNNLGRHWGTCRKELIPFADRWVMRLSDPKFVKLLENAACMTFPYFTRDVDQGFSLFGKMAKKCIEIICRTDLDEKLLLD